MGEWSELQISPRPALMAALAYSDTEPVA